MGERVAVNPMPAGSLVPSLASWFPPARLDHVPPARPAL